MTVLREAMIEFLNDGLGAAAEVYPVRLPIHPEMPAIVMRYVSDFSGHVHTGPDGLVKRRVQLDIYAEDHDASDVLAGQVRALLDGYRGPWGMLITVGACLKDNEFDVDEPDTGLWRRVQDYLVEYNEAIGS